MGGYTMDDEDTASGWTWRFIFVMLIAYMTIPACLFSFGVINSPSQLIKDFMNQTEVSRTGHPMDEAETDSLFGLLVAVFGIGAAFGSFTATPISNKIGRKYASVVTCVAGGLGILLMASCDWMESYEVLFVGRVIIGIATGWTLGVSIAYVNELCSPPMRTTITLISQIVQSLAVWIGQICGFEELMGNQELWTYLLGVPVVVLILQLTLFPFCPESPRFLLMKKEDENGAKKVLRSLRGRDDVDKDINQLYQELQSSKLQAQTSFFQLFTTPTLRRPFIISMILGLQLDWCGMTGILFFSESMFEDIGISPRVSRYATSGTGAILFLGGLLSVFLLSRFRRKLLLKTGNLGLAVCSAAFAITTMYKDELDVVKYLNIGVSLLVAVFFSCTISSAFWVVVTELYPDSARTAGMSAAVLCSFASFFTHCYLFPELLRGLESYTFFLYATVDIFVFIFVYFFVPETKDRSFEDLVREWSGDQDEIEKDENTRTFKHFKGKEGGNYDSTTSFENRKF